MILGGLFGFVLLFVADKIRSKPNFANGLRITQSLSGAGIAVLYVSLFAATTLYNLLPDLIGLIGMGAVTAIAVGLSLRHGAPIALLGLIGGFLTPALVSTSQPANFITFIYLYFVFAGLMTVIKHKDWWLLSIPCVIGVFLWVMLAIFNGLSGLDSLYLILFLIAICATIVVCSKDKVSNSDSSTSFKDISTAVNFLGLGGAVVLMSVVTTQTDFGFIEWALLALVSVGSVGLAYFKEKIYAFFPWVTMLANAMLLFMWQPQTANGFSLTLIVFAGIYTLAAYALLWRGKLPLLWAGLLASTAIGYYLLAYFKLHYFMPSEAIIINMPFVWGAIAFAASGLAVQILRRAKIVFSEHRFYDHIIAILTVTATAFISIGFAVELSRDFLPIAIAVQVLVIGWISTQTNIKVLRPIVVALTIVFGLLLVPQLLQLLLHTSIDVLGIYFDKTANVAILQQPLLHLALPALLLLATNYFLGFDKSVLAIALEIFAVVLISLMLIISVHAQLLSLAIAFELLMVAAIGNRILQIPRWLSLGLTILFGLVLLPQVLLLLQLTTYSLIEVKMNLLNSVPMVQSPVIQLGLPALVFLGSSYLLRRDKDDNLVHTLETVAITLTIVMAYYLTRHLFHVADDVLFVKANFFERGVITNLLFAFGLGCFAIGHYFNRSAFRYNGLVIVGVALFRVIYFDLLMYNPLWASQQIAGWFVFNSLLLPFGLPVAWSYLTGKALKLVDRAAWAEILNKFMLVLLFVLISLNVRYVFHGEYLNQGVTGNGEIYSYSLAWLLFGIGLLVAGVIKENKALRYASLGVMILVVGKVFLYDTSELEGLYRVFSFFGLGLSLLALSWFYSRFVFNKQVKDEEIIS